MAIHFVCPSGHPLKANRSLIGQSVRCGECRQTVIVPPANTGADGKPLEGDSPSLRKQWRERRRRKREEAAEQTSLHAAAAAATTQPALPPKPMRRIERARRAISDDVYRPDPRYPVAVRWLGLILAGIAALSLLPLLVTANVNLVTAPAWARVALLLAAAQFFYIAWMVAAPDWSTVWVLMIVFAIAAACYGAATAAALATPLHQPVVLGMSEIRETARGWCACMVLTMSLGTYLCGRLATRWRRAFENEMAVRVRMAGGLK
jgi:cation transport ATPase